jgi:antitoxin MazE
MPGSLIEKTSKVSRWGNSLGLRIPQEGVDLLSLRDGETVKIQIKGDTITIRRTKPRRKWTEAELLEGLTPELCGPEIIKGRSGKEIL